MKPSFVLLTIVFAILFASGVQASEGPETLDPTEEIASDADELPGCAIRPTGPFSCQGVGRYQDTGCAITCPANKTPVCTKAYCEGTVGKASDCYCK